MFRGDPKVWGGIPTKQGDLAVMNGNHETKRIRYDVFISGEQRISFSRVEVSTKTEVKCANFCLHCFGGWEISRSTCHNYVGEDVHIHQVTCWPLYPRFA